MLKAHTPRTGCSFTSEGSALTEVIPSTDETFSTRIVNGSITDINLQSPVGKSLSDGAKKAGLK
ncbi:Uncharacterized protein DAT39_000045 [Clarias magur]|uniref:Uncharacterized protein n=1 Tax=Clarias magur TaxID=1594786 RepID=A0A8J4XJW6_CLAMG|nr:Uncharacterized protein DAT39_000045 [Clarias magur]